MDAIPDEILLLIFNLVCTERRTTARALSAVSKRFHAISPEFLYRIVDIAGYENIRQLVSNLESTPARARHIRHLCISDTSGIGRPQYPVLEPEAHEMDGIIRMLEIAAPTVESMGICLLPTKFNTPIMSRLFLLPLPRLHELSIVGPFPFPYSSTGIFPALKYLHLSGKGWKIGVENTPGLFSSGTLASSFPSLTHLHVSGLSRHFTVTIAEELGSSNNNSERFQLFPPKLEALAMRLFSTGPWTHQKHRNILRRSKTLGANNLTFDLYFLPNDDVFPSDIRRDWLDRLAGGEGCWRLAEKFRIA